MLFILSNEVQLKPGLPCKQPCFVRLEWGGEIDWVRLWDECMLILCIHWLFFPSHGARTTRVPLLYNVPVLVPQFTGL